jgi:hypothetical protein
MGKPPASARKLKASSNSSSETEQPIESHPKKKRQLSSPSSIKESQPQPTAESTQGPFDSSLMDMDNFMTINWQDDVFETSAFGAPSTAELQLSADNLFDLSFDFMGDSTVQLPNSNQFVFTDDSSIESSRAQSDDSMFEIQQVPKHSPPSVKSSPYPAEKVPLKLCTHKLDLARNSLPSPLSHTNTTIDQVLINNKAAIENADALLACSCSENTHFALSLALICNKILRMYEDVIKATATACISPASGRRRSDLPIGITVGAYKMDAEDEERMRIQIVVNELRKVKGLVDKYASKYCKKGANGDAGDGIYSALESFLRSRLTTTLQDLLNKLEG